MAQPPAFQFYAADFLVGTALMSLEARGAYITLLAVEWEKGCVPGDPVARARVLGVRRATAEKIWTQIREKFIENADGSWFNPRLETERVKQTAYHTAQRENGRNGANLRWQRHANATSQPIAAPSSGQWPKDASSSSSSFKDLSIQTPGVIRSGYSAPRVAQPPVDPLSLRAGRLLERYAELFYEHRKGARYHSRLHLDFQKACDLVRTWTDDARLEKLAVIVLTTDDEWIARTDRGFAVFVARATWADDRLREWEITNQVQT